MSVKFSVNELAFLNNAQEQMKLVKEQHERLLQESLDVVSTQLQHNWELLHMGHRKIVDHSLNPRDQKVSFDEALALLHNPDSELLEHKQPDPPKLGTTLRSFGNGGTPRLSNGGEH